MRDLQTRPLRNVTSDAVETQRRGLIRAGNTEMQGRFSGFKSSITPSYRPSHKLKLAVEY
jgi:hypothetical protein